MRVQMDRYNLPITPCQIILMPELAESPCVDTKLISKHIISQEIHLKCLQELIRVVISSELKVHLKPNQAVGVVKLRFSQEYVAHKDTDITSVEIFTLHYEPRYPRRGTNPSCAIVSVARTRHNEEWHVTLLSNMAYDMACEANRPENHLTIWSDLHTPISWLANLK